MNKHNRCILSTKTYVIYLYTIIIYVLKNELMNIELLTINNDSIHIPIIKFILSNKFIKKDCFYNFW